MSRGYTQPRVLGWGHYHDILHLQKIEANNGRKRTGHRCSRRLVRTVDLLHALVAHTVKRTAERKRKASNVKTYT